MNYKKLEREIFHYIEGENPDAGKAMLKAMRILQEANLDEYAMLDFSSLIEYACSDWEPS
jgi:hypothetical protein